MRTNPNLGLSAWACAAALVLTAVACSKQSAPSVATRTPVAPASPGALDRTVLPIPEPHYPLATELDARNAKAPPRFDVKAPKGAPNVVIFLIDDIGFGHTSPFGGAIPMPTLERLAQQGLKYNRFHTTALCSPTRVALLTGRNHHPNNAGAIMEIATAFPGNTGVRPQSITPLAEILRQNGYSTAAFGKYHETPPWEVSVSGPFDRWPTHSGFDKFYGFIGGETNQWAPLVYDGTVKAEVPHDPSYHFTTDMTNQAIRWIRSEQSLTPDKPFFVYFATGATHAPHHVPKEWIAKFKGKFDGGWDKYREETFERQKQMGIVPQHAKLAPKPEAIKDWDKLTPDEQRLFARQMEVFAAFAAHTDYEIGRVVKAIEDLGELDNTLIMYEVGDNGASAEGGPVGMFNEMTYFNGVQETVPDMLKNMDKWGGPETFPHMAAGWAVAGDTPFMWTKQVASNFGGTRNPLVISWPARIKAKGEIRSQFQHVVDIAPTVLEAAGLPEPKTVNGVVQTPMEGVSLVYTFADGNAAGRHKTQYFEILGNRAIYSDGWVAATVHKAPWEAAPRHPLAEDVWELYNVNEDFSESNDLAKANPAKLKEMQALFMKEAEQYRVLPIDDRGIERFDPTIAGRPDLMAGRKSLTVYEGMTDMMENAFINVKNQSVTLTAEVEIPTGGANGVIICQGGRFGGWSLYVKDGKPAYTYNFVGLQEYTVHASERLGPGKATIKLEFAYDGNGRGKGGTSTLFINGKKVGSGRVDRTEPNVFSADDAADVGVDEGTNVSVAYKERDNRFTGKIEKVVIEVGASNSGAEETAQSLDLEEAAVEAEE
jgi:arylsulfatase A-like enzyme